MIHGTATTCCSVLGLGVANAVGIQIPQMTPKQFFLVLGFSALGSGAAYLRQSPWARAEDDTDFVAKKVEGDAVAKAGS